MPDASVRKARLWLFVGKFIVGIVVLLGVWWGFLMLGYAWILGKVCALIAGTLLGMDVTQVELQPKGLFNTETLLNFVFSDKPHPFPVALLITNIPPFAALVLATSGLGIWHRLRVLLAGVGILFASHVLFVSVLLRFQEQLKTHPEVPTAIMQVIIATLPFILWIRLAYWDRVSALLREGLEDANRR